MGHLLYEQEFLLIDRESGKAVPYEKVKDEFSISYIAENVPPVGYRIYEIKEIDGNTPHKEDLKSGEGFIENRYYRVGFNPETGDIESIIDKRSGKELIELDEFEPFNGLFRESHSSIFSGGFPNKIEAQASDVRIEMGRYMVRLVVERAGTEYPLSTYTLYSDMDRIDISNKIDDRVIGNISKYEGSVWFGFTYPFRSIDNADINVHFGGVSGNISLSSDYMPGVIPSALFPQHYTALWQGKDNGILFFNRQSAVANVSSAKIGVDPFLFRPHLYHIVYNKSSYGTSWDRGDHLYERLEPLSSSKLAFDFSFKSVKGEFDPVDAQKSGWEFNVPLETRLLYGENHYGDLNEDYYSFFSIDSDSVVLLTVKKPEDGTGGEYVIRFREIAGKEREFTVILPFKAGEVYLADLIERRGDAISGSGNQISLKINPYETLTIRVIVDDERR